MHSLARRLLCCAGLATLTTLAAVESADAKILPVQSVSVATVRPQVGQPVDVVVRFAPTFNLGDQYAWASNEIEVFPSSRTDGDGWPLDRNDAGLPIQLQHVGRAVYRGSFTVPIAGDYVVVSRSALYSHEDQTQGVVVTRKFPTPLRLQILVASNAPKGSSGISMLAIGVTAAFLAAIGAVVGIWLGTRRRSRERVEEPAMMRGEDRVLVGDSSDRE